MGDRLIGKSERPHFDGIFQSRPGSIEWRFSAKGPLLSTAPNYPVDFMLVEIKKWLVFVLALSPTR